MTHPYARRRTAAGGALAAAALLVLLAPTAEAADPLPAAATPRDAAAAPATLDTLARFFASPGAAPAAPAAATAAARPRVEGPAVPVHVLSPDFVAGRPGAAVARVEFHAARAVAGDGRTASVWTARRGGGWQVVNIATGDDEVRYAEQGARRLPGGTVFREPQIDAWYVVRGRTVLPLDEDAVRAVGADGTTLAAYRDRVKAAYGDKLPGSAYARGGRAGGYGPGPAPATGRAEQAAPAGTADATGSAGATATAAAAGTALLAAALTALRARSRRRASGAA
ncbi:hypothetical protein [Streptomyces roseolilacinus]|uniref:hypothetical protein n=1 Tax=Streptomyces roseolilacinus TaxID=66904 RepID=UPI0038049A16